MFYSYFIIDLEEEKKFYKTFWSTRVYFSNPPSIFDGDNFKKLQEGTNIITQKFQSIAEKEAEVLGARKSAVGMKRAHSESSMQLDEQDSIPAEELLKEINRDFQFPRLLSSRKLLDLEASLFFYIYINVFYIHMSIYTIDGGS